MCPREGHALQTQRVLHGGLIEFLDRTAGYNKNAPLGALNEVSLRLFRIQFGRHHSARGHIQNEVSHVDTVWHHKAQVLEPLRCQVCTACSCTS